MLENLSEELTRFTGSTRGNRALIFWAITFSFSLLGLFLSLIVIIKILRFWGIRAAQAQKLNNVFPKGMPKAAQEVETLMARLSMFMALIDTGVSAIRIFQTLAFGPGGASTRSGQMILNLCYSSPWYQALLHVYFAWVILMWVTQADESRSLNQDFWFSTRVILCISTGMMFLGTVEDTWSYIVQFIASLICMALMVTFIAQTTMVLMRREAEEASNNNKATAEMVHVDDMVIVKRRLRNRLLRAGGASRRLRQRLTGVLMFAICAWISSMIGQLMIAFMEPSLTSDVAISILSIPLYMIAMIDAIILGNAVQTLLRWLHISKAARIRPRKDPAEQHKLGLFSYQTPPHRPLSRSTNINPPNFVLSLMPICESSSESKVARLDNLDDIEDVEDPLASARARGDASPTPQPIITHLNTLSGIRRSIPAMVVEE